jgi:peptidoglycan/LPS O-acetylase OafA/YrhL
MADKLELRYRSLDHWRGVAALAVVLFHGFGAVRLGGQTVHPSIQWLKWLSDFGWFGVHLFFVISGYCIAANVCRLVQHRLGPWDFLRDRLLRIYPTYWGACLFALIVALGSLPFNHTSLAHNLPSGPLAAVSNLLLVEPYVGVDPFLLVSWSLVYELGFYVLVALGFGLVRAGMGFSWALVAAVALGVLALFGPWKGALYVLNLWPEFLSGGIVFVALWLNARGVAQLPPPVSLPVVAQPPSPVSVPVVTQPPSAVSAPQLPSPAHSRSTPGRQSELLQAEPIAHFPGAPITESADGSDGALGSSPSSCSVGAPVSGTAGVETLSGTPRIKAQRSARLLLLVPIAFAVIGLLAHSNANWLGSGVGAALFALALYGLHPLDRWIAGWRPLAWLAWVGTFSYSLYLVHVSFGRVLNLGTRVIPADSVWFIFLVVGYWIVAIAGAWVFYQLCEAPLERWRQRLKRG